MGIYHAMILIDLFALCLGVGIICVALLSWERSGIRWMRDLALVLGAGTVLLILDIFRIYSRTAGWSAGPIERTVLAVLSGTGNFVAVAAIPVFVRGITPFPLNRTRRVLGLIGIVLFPLVGVLDEAIDAMPFHVMNDVGMAFLLGAAAIILGIGYRRIAEPETRRMVNRMMWLTIATVVLGRVQLMVTNLLGVSWDLRRIRVVAIFYYYGVLAVVLGYAIRHLFRPTGAADMELPREFTDRYGISNRERDIIAMIVQGHSNRAIGEHLYISDRTVKNHISSIYRKTGVINRVQLLNMVRNQPGSRVDPAGPGRAAIRQRM